MKQLLHYIGKSLAEKRFMASTDGDDQFIYYLNVNYKYVISEVTDKEETVGQFIVIRLYVGSTFINLWIDKKWGDEDWSMDAMGNGFIHKTIYTEKDWDAFLPVVNMAM